MPNKEQYYPNVNEKGYTYSQIENLTYIPHVHEQVELVCLLSGNLQMMVDGKNYNLRVGDISMVMPCHRHSYTTRQSSSTFVCALYSNNRLISNPYLSGKYDLRTPVIRRG